VRTTPSLPDRTRIVPWRFVLVLALGLGIIAAACPAAAAAGEPPAAARQPPAPGYSYAHKAVKRQEFGSGARSYWLFEPAEPTPESAPVVVFNHGWYAYNPAAYGAWIEHLVRSGQIVIFPRYQADRLTPPSEFLANALSAVHDALDVLETSPVHIRPDRRRFALIGHSAGGNLAAQMAAIALDNNLPLPRAVVAVMPGEVVPSRDPSLAKIPATTLLVVTAAEDDRIVGDLRAREIFAQATAIPAARKKYVLFRTDLHGWLVADHFAPTAASRDLNNGEGLLLSLQFSRARVDAFDWAGFWRLADITIQAGFRGLTLDDATDHGTLFRHLGYWSDGRPVYPPIVGDDLATIPRVFPSNGLRLFKWPPPDLLSLDPPTPIP
jgi:acetyl esterase/lipase